MYLSYILRCKQHTLYSNMTLPSRKYVLSVLAVSGILALMLFRETLVHDVTSKMTSRGDQAADHQRTSNYRTKMLNSAGTIVESSSNSSHDSPEMIERARVRLDSYENIRAEKWIVVTSIQAPTDQLRKMTNLTGWSLVVVGDKKSPADWSLEGAVYLGVAEQRLLGYAITDHISYGTYGRKSIGYLFAIQHGAEYIYDTDDDNVPTVDLENFSLTTELSTGLVVKTTNQTYNPCRHFGQSNMWPRGYPLSRISLPDPRQYEIQKIPPPVIKQGLVNGDPDLDAIYRLTRKHTDRQLDLSFDTSAPPVVLPAGTYAPMNAQNTMYAKRAFWGLLLPVTVSDRISDIHRAYWSQKLLWSVGDKIAFFPPNAYQERNAHSYLVDAKLETFMYHINEELLNLISRWQCDQGKLFVECIREMTDIIVRADIWGNRDSMLVEAWLNDLTKIGYAFPKRINFPASKLNEKHLHHIDIPIIFYPNEQPTSWIATTELRYNPELTNAGLVEKLLQQSCHETYAPGDYTRKLMPTIGEHTNVTAAGGSINRSATRDLLSIILVVGVNSIDKIPHIEAIHRPRYWNIIYCTADGHKEFFNHWKLTSIQLPSVSLVSCLRAARAMNHIASGYLFIQDSTVMLYTGPTALDHTWMAIGGPGPTRNDSTPICQETGPILVKWWRAISIQLHIDINHNKAEKCVVERYRRRMPVVYIPRKLSHIAGVIETVLHSSPHCMQDMLLTILTCIDPHVIHLEGDHMATAGFTGMHFISNFNYTFTVQSSDAQTKTFCKLV